MYPLPLQALSINVSISNLLAEINELELYQ